jgi:hypothetical protein
MAGWLPGSVVSPVHPKARPHGAPPNTHAVPVGLLCRSSWTVQLPPTHRFQLSWQQGPWTQVRESSALLLPPLGTHMRPPADATDVM